jgi:hypothetical protein
MSCEAVNAYLARESNRISGDIARRGRLTSPWNAMLEKDFFPDEMGSTISKVIYQRTIPDGGSWNMVAPSGTSVVNEGPTINPSTACNPSAALLQSRQIIQTASLYEFVVDSDPICITDARMGYRFQDQVREIKRNFEKNVIDLWEDRNRDQYVAALPDENKLVFAGGALVEGSGGAFDGTAPTSQIHQDALDAVRWKMIHDGAGEEGAYGQIDGQPIFTVFMSGEQQRALIKGNESVRNDYRWAEPKELLKPFGVKRVYAGFYHIIDDKAPRWNFEEAGTWTRVPFYITDEDGIAIVNPAYEAALYEDVIVYHPKVVRKYLQKPLASIGGGTTFKAWDFAGEIQWINAYDKTCNKYLDNGFWSARLRAAYQAQIPNYGYAIRVLRCPDSLGTTSCPA